MLLKPPRASCSFFRYNLCGTPELGIPSTTRQIDGQTRRNRVSEVCGEGERLQEGDDGSFLYCNWMFFFRKVTAAFVISSPFFFLCQFLLKGSVERSLLPSAIFLIFRQMKVLQLKQSSTFGASGTQWWNAFNFLQNVSRKKRSSEKLESNNF